MRKPQNLLFQECTGSSYVQYFYKRWISTSGHQLSKGINEVLGPYDEDNESNLPFKVEIIRVANIKKKKKIHVLLSFSSHRIDLNGF